MLPRLSLRRKLLLAFTIVLLPVLALLLIDFQSTQQNARDSILREQLLGAQAVGVQVDETFDAAIGLAWAVANDPVTQSMDPQQLDPHLKRLLSVHPVYDAIVVFDGEGVNRGWGQLEQPAEPRLNIAERRYFQQVMSSNAPVVSNVLQLGRPQVVGVVAGVPLRGPDQRPIGVVVVATRTDQLAARYQSAALRSGQAIFLVDRTGRLAFHTERLDLPFQESAAFASFPQIQKALAGELVMEENYSSPIVQDDRLGAFAPTPKYGWVVGVSVPRAVALAAGDDAFRRQLAGFIAILLLSGGLALGLARLFSAPVRHLEESVRAFGRGDLGRRADIHTGDEIEALSTSFNDMASRLQGRELEVLRLRAEAERRARQLAAVIDSMNEAVMVAGPDNRLLEINPAGERLVGMEGQMTVGAPLADYLARFDFRFPDGRSMQTAETPLALALAGQSVSGFELRLRTADGSDRLVTASGGPVRDEAGRLILGVVVVRDITNERRREEEKAATAEIARSLVRELELKRLADVVMEQSVLALGADAVELYLADPLRQELVLLAHNHSTMAPETEREIVRVPYGAEQVSAWVARSGRMRHVEDLGAVVNEFPKSNQIGRREGYRSLLVLPLHNRDRLVGVLTLLARAPYAFTTRDLGLHATVADLFAVAIENAHLYDEVREALRLRDEFIASAAHELKTPVTVIKGWAQILSLAGNRDPEERNALATIDRQADRVGRFVDDLLSAASLTPGSLPSAPEEVDLSLFVRALVDNAGGSVEHCSVRASADTPLPVLADRRLLADLLWRLLENAVRYSPPGSTIEVETRPSGGYAVVSVRDHGVGIPVERQPYVFEPFYQPVPPGLPGYVGVVSLGLHLSKQMVEAMGGRIWFVSEQGRGSTFSFSLPLHEPQR